MSKRSELSIYRKNLKDAAKELERLEDDRCPTHGIPLGQDHRLGEPAMSCPRRDCCFFYLVRR